MGILGKSTIEKWILPHLTIGERGFEILAIFQGLKKGSVV
jgi:hypothetical protein